MTQGHPFAAGREQKKGSIRVLPKTMHFLRAICLSNPACNAGPLR